MTFLSGGNTGNCGCFGELIAMTPIEAIIKNIVAVGLLVWLWKILENDKKSNFWILTTVTLACILGLFMIAPIKELDFNDYSESIPAFICILAMPLTYSIAEGITLGVLSYVFINALAGKFKKLSIGMYILAILFILKYIFI